MHELSGGEKRKEDVSGLFRAAESALGRYGRLNVQFGELLTIDGLLAEIGEHSAPAHPGAAASARHTPRVSRDERDQPRDGGDTERPRRERAAHAREARAPARRARRCVRAPRAHPPCRGSPLHSVAAWHLANRRPSASSCVAMRSAKRASSSCVPATSRCTAPALPSRSAIVTRPHVRARTRSTSCPMPIGSRSTSRRTSSCTSSSRAR